MENAAGGVAVVVRANNPHGYGPIDPQRFVPFPKNPTIVKFFIQLGRVEELGSGVLNINRYLEAYFGTGKPEFIESEVFKVCVSLPDSGKKAVFIDLQSEEELLGKILDALSRGLNDGDDGVKLETAKVIELILKKEGINTREITEMTSKSKPPIEKYLRIARTASIIQFSGAPKTGGYYATKRMKAQLKGRE